MQKKIGLTESIFIGLGGTSPALSISTTIAILIGTIGLLSIQSVIYSFIIISGIALAFVYLSEIKTDDGASFTWVSAIFGSFIGFMSGWAIIISSVTYLVSATPPTATGVLEIVKPSLATDQNATLIVGLILLAIINLVILRGISFASKVESIVTGLSLVSMVAIIVATVYKFANVGGISIPDLSNIFIPMNFETFTSGALMTIFLFLGFDTAMNVGEETENAKKKMIIGTSVVMFTVAVLSVLSILAIYATTPVEEIIARGPSIIFDLANSVLPKPFGTIAILTILISSIGAIESSIISFIQTLFSMSEVKAMSHHFLKKTKKTNSPWVAILTIWILSSIIYIAAMKSLTMGNLIEAAINATSIQMAFYYSTTGLACAWYFRKNYRKATDMLLKIIYPALSAVILALIILYSIKTLDKASIIIGFGLLFVGIIPYLLNRKKIKKEIIK